MLKILSIEEEEIPNDYVYDTENSEVYAFRHKYTGREIHIAKESPLYINAILIPENATNGDMIKAVFQKDNTLINYLSEYITDHLDKDWWNAPYQKEKKI